LPAKGSYEMVYEKQQITLNPSATSSCVYREIDLDQPYVGSDTDTGDVKYTHCSSQSTGPELLFADKRLASPPTANASPEDCVRRIGSAPIDVNVTPSQDLVLCAVTDGVGELNQPQRPKIALVTINAVGDDGTVNATLTAWALPR
jgi:hypothetical protein